MSASTPSLVWSDPRLWVSPTSVGTQTLQDLLVWKLPSMTEKARNSKRCRLSPVKSWVAWFSSHCRTCAVPSLAVPCSGFSQFPTISASDFHMGSCSAIFTLLLLRWLASFPLSQLLRPSGKRYHQLSDPSGRSHSPSKEGHRVCAAPD